MKKSICLKTLLLGVLIVFGITNPVFGEWSISGDNVYYLGNVGIGTSNPNQELHVKSSGHTDVKIDAPLNRNAAVLLCEADDLRWFLYNDADESDRFRIANGSKDDLVTVEPNGHVGIGTSNPNQELHIKGSDHTDVKIEAPYNFNAAVLLYEADDLRWFLYNDADESDRFRIANGSKDDLVTVEPNGNVGIGTSNPNNKLEVKGTIRAEEVIVETGWPDFVFDNDYILMDLDEVENYIEKKGHLPGIQTAKEVKSNGISIGEFQAKLLQKVEELTLYVINQKKEIDRLKSQLARLN